MSNTPVVRAIDVGFGLVKLSVRGRDGNQHCPEDPHPSVRRAFDDAKNA